MSSDQRLSTLTVRAHRRPFEAGKGVQSSSLATSEREFLQQVADLARLVGWKTYHPWLSIRSEHGWPDLALVRPPRLILAELKTDKGKTTPHQDEWLALLRACPGVETYLWRPSDFDAIAKTLSVKDAP